MIIEVVPISSLRLDKVHYYSVRVNGKALTEFRDFYNRLSQDETNSTELGELNRFIKLIGEQYGATPQHFKTEDAAERLPPPYFETDSETDYGIRLYCIRLCPTIVILLNGDRKTAGKVKDCVRCYPHFDFARKLAKKITECIIDKSIILDIENKEIIIDDDFELIL